MFARGDLPAVEEVAGSKVVLLLVAAGAIFSIHSK